MNPPNDYSKPMLLGGAFLAGPSPFDAAPSPFDAGAVKTGGGSLSAEGGVVFDSLPEFLDLKLFVNQISGKFAVFTFSGQSTQGSSKKVIFILDAALAKFLPLQDSNWGNAQLGHLGPFCFANSSPRILVHGAWHT